MRNNSNSNSNSKTKIGGRLRCSSGKDIKEYSSAKGKGKDIKEYQKRVPV